MLRAGARLSPATPSMLESLGAVSAALAAATAVLRVPRARGAEERAPRRAGAVGEKEKESGRGRMGLAAAECGG